MGETEQERRATLVRERDYCQSRISMIERELGGLPPGNRSVRREAAAKERREYKAFQKRLGAAIIRAFEALKVSGMGVVCSTQ